MGQSSSSNFQNSPQPLFNRRKPGPSPSHPISPHAEVTPTKIPSYAVAENKVFPNGAIDANLARKQLRPVSQELSKFHLDFADAFNGAALADKEKETHNNRNENNVSNNKENTTPISNLPLRPTPEGDIMNGKIKVDIRRSVSSDNVSTSKRDPPYLRRDSSTEDVVDRSLQRIMPARSVSMASSLEQPGKAIKHKRQTSLANGTPVQHTVIQEDPREHLYNEGREQSYPNYQPSTSSLPVKNTFEMDYSLNLTYAQLAEYRRNKRTSGLGDGVDQKLKDLVAEIQANSSVPKSPFDMQNLGARSSTLSISTASSDTGVSKSKKKKAPPPPTTPRKASLGQDSEHQIKAFGQGFPGQKPLERSASTLVKSSKAPAPSPLMKSQSVARLQEEIHPTKPALNSLASLPKPNIDFGKLESRYSDRNRLSLILDTASVHKDKGSTQPHSDSKGNEINSTINRALLDKPGSKVHASECDVVTEMLNLVKDEKLRDGDLSSSSEGPLMPGQIKQATKSLTAELEINKTSLVANSYSRELKSASEFRKPKIPEQNNLPSFDEARFSPRAKEADFSTPFDSDSGPHEKNMNSDLQRDIVLAAQFRTVKAEQRRIGDEDRDFWSSCGTTEKEQESTYKGKDEIASKNMNNNQEDCLLDRKSVIELSNPIVRKDFELKPQGLSLIRLFRQEQPDSTLIGKSGTSNCQPTESATVARNFDNVLDSAAMNLNKRGSVQSEDMSICSSNSSQRVFSPEWTPEQDLESDDDIMDESILRTHRRAASEGFKPSLLPSKIFDSQDDGANNPKVKNRKDSSVTEQGQTKDATKFGSIQKLKKSVHKSAKQVFGSISKGGGDKSSRRKSHDLSAPDKSDSVAVSADLEHTHNSNWILTKSDLPDSSFCSADEKLRRQRVPLSPTSNSHERDTEARSSFSDFVNIDLPSRGISPDQEQGIRLTRIDLPSQPTSQDTMVQKHSATRSLIYETLVDSRRHAAAEERVETHHPHLDQNHDLFRPGAFSTEKSKLKLESVSVVSENPQQYQQERVGEPEMGFKGQLFQHPLTLAESKLSDTVRPLWTSDPYQVVQSSHHGLSGANLFAFGSPNSIATTGNSMLGTGTIVKPNPYQIHGHVPMLAADYTYPLTFSGLFQQPTPFLPAVSYPVLPLPHNTVGHNLVYPQFGIFQHSAEPRATSVAPTNPGSLLTPLDMSYLSQQMRMIGVTPPANQEQWNLLLSTLRYQHPSGGTSELVQFGTLSSSADTEKRLSCDTTLDDLAVKSKTQSENVNDASLMLPTQISNDRILLFDQGESSIRRVEDQTSQREAPLADDLTQANHLPSVLVASTGSTTITKASTIKNHHEMTTTRNHIEPGISTEERSTPENTVSDQCPEETSVLQSFAESQGSPTPITSPRIGTNVFQAKLYGPMGFRPVAFHPGSPR